MKLEKTARKIDKVLVLIIGIGVLLMFLIGTS